MGLDMYMEKRNYVKNWKHQSKEERHTFSIKRNGKKVEDIKPDRIKYIVEEVAYWRKANAIHNYFVEVVAGGGEFKNCGEINVSHEDLKELLNRINKILDTSEIVKGKIADEQTMTKDGWKDNLEDGEYIKDATTVKELLPTQSGFFLEQRHMTSGISMI
jgi:hypothetical protein